MRLEELLRNHVRERIKSNSTAISMIVRLVESVEITSIVEAAGFDSFYIDLEHAPMSLRAASQIFISALHCGITPFVRVPTAGPEFVSRALDAGAMGVIAPHITSAEAARAVVDLAKFSPHGSRSVTAGIPQLFYRNWDAAEARRIINDLTTVVCMVEDHASVKKASEIAAVEGVDILHVGSNDLLADLGLHGQFTHPALDEAIMQVIDACNAAGIHAGLGGLHGHPDLLEKYTRAGAKYITVGSDLSFLQAGMKGRVEALRKITG